MIKTILYIGISQCLFALLTNLGKKDKNKADRILLVWLLTIVLQFLLLLLEEEHRDFLDLEFSTGLIPLTFGPFLYLYSAYLTGSIQKFRWRQLLHFLPFILITTILIGGFSGKLNFEEVSYLERDPYLLARVMFAGIFFSSILIYTVLTFVQVRQFRKGISNTFSFSSGRNDLVWLGFISILFSLTFFLYFLSWAINAVLATSVIDSQLFFVIGLTLLAFGVSYFGTKQTPLFRLDKDEAWSEVQTELALMKSEEQHAEQIQIHAEEDNTQQSEVEKYRKSGLRDEMANEIERKLLTYMRDQKPYLNPELTIVDLSVQLQVSKHHLTQVINNKVGKNFFNFINDYRIEAVKQKLKDPNMKHLTLLAIALDSGFNSKSSFNSLFKQYTGMTPTEWRKSQENQTNS